MHVIISSYQTLGIGYFPSFLYIMIHFTVQDMSSLMHTIYDVVDASVNHSCQNKSKTLRVKLTVSPENRSHRRDTGTGEKPVRGI